MSRWIIRNLAGWQYHISITNNRQGDSGGLISPEEIFGLSSRFRNCCSETTARVNRWRKFFKCSKRQATSFPGQPEASWFADCHFLNSTTIHQLHGTLRLISEKICLKWFAKWLGKCISVLSFYPPFPIEWHSPNLTMSEVSHDDKNAALEKLAEESKTAFDEEVRKTVECSRCRPDNKRKTLALERAKISIRGVWG